MAFSLPFFVLRGQTLAAWLTELAAALPSTDGGITSSAHGHTTAGALSIPRVAGDQKTLVSVEADATSWGDNLTTTLDNLHAVLAGSGTETFTVDLSNELNGVDAAFTIHPDTLIEVSVMKIDATLSAKALIVEPGTGAAVNHRATASAAFATTANPTITLPGAVVAGDKLVLFVTGLSLSVTSVGGGGTQVVPLTNHITLTGSTRDYDVTAWEYDVTAGDVTAGTISTVIANARSYQAEFCTGGTVVAETVVGGTNVQDLATGATTPPADGTLILSAMSAFNASADALAPSNMTATGTAQIGSADRVVDLAYFEQATAGTFTPAVWDGTTSVDMMGVTVQVRP